MLTRELLKTLKSTEWEELNRFLPFRFPRMRADVLLGLNAFKKNQSDSISRKDVHLWLYPQKPFDDKVIRYLLTDINKVVFEYFSFKQLTKQPQKQQSLLLQELSDRKCHRAFDKTYNQELNRAETQGHVDSDALHYRYELYSLKAKEELDSGKRSSDVFEESSLFLDLYFVAKKLQISAEKINLNFILKKEWNDPFLKTILEQIDNGLFNDSPYIKLYRSIVQSLTEPDNEAVFETLKTEIPTLINQLSESELSDLYQYLLNYCIRRINAGRLVFQNELLAVYQNALSDGALFTNGSISQWDFKNIVTISLRTGNVDYAREFIHSYKQRLPAAQRINALAYNLANLHFSEKNFRSTIKQLQKVDLDDVFYRLDARSILLKSYYELDDADALHYHATAFRSFLNRNRKISDQQRKLYLNLIKHTLSLSRFSGEITKLKAIQQRITTNPNVADLSWLESKITEIHPNKPPS
ncbi:MAG TPA: hypothetical protein DCR04_05370 [Flavobacteriales bacterium]|nr:hypothetical protein [Flavobacteriales bacterium]